jgi:hypothetical protein
MKPSRSPILNPPPRQIVRSGVPGKGVWEAREEAWELLRPARQRAILAMLRGAFAEGERGLAGWPEILAWLDAHHFRNRQGRKLNERTVRGWVRNHKCPILRGVRCFPGRSKSSPAWTSTFLLLAWAASLYSSSARGRPRIDSPGIPKSPVRPSKYRPQNRGGSSSVPAPSTRASQPAPSPESTWRRPPRPPEHGAPPPRGA